MGKKRKAGFCIHREKNNLYKRKIVYNFSSAQKTVLTVNIHKFVVKAFPK